MTEPHCLSQHPHRALLFDGEAERYDRCRPGYPDQLVDDVLGPAPQGLSVLDVGCGTGIASRLMAERGAQVLGVELNPRMAAIARRHGIEVEEGAFELWDARGRSFDRVTCAQAWHWLDLRVSPAKAAALLRPGGRLCLVWSVGDHPAQLADALRAAYRRALPPDVPPPLIGYGSNTTEEAEPGVAAVVDGLRPCAALGEPQVAWYRWTRTYTRDEWLDQLGTHSDHMALAPDTRQRVLEEVGAAIDDFGGDFEMTFLSVLISATRR